MELLLYQLPIIIYYYTTLIKKLKNNEDTTKEMKYYDLITNLFLIEYIIIAIVETLKNIAKIIWK